MNDQVIDQCDWCEQTKPLYFIDGFWFCCEQCENKYYDDREKRKNGEHFSVYLERNIHRYITTPD